MPKPKPPAPPTDRIVRRPAAERKRLPPDLEAFARGDERALDRKSKSRGDRVDDPRAGYLIPGVANRHARAVHDARIAGMKSLIAQGDQGRDALGDALADAIRLGLWRGRSIVDFEAMVEEELGIPAADARSLAESSATSKGMTLEPISERAVAAWFRVEAAGLEEDPSARVDLRGSRAVIEVDFSRLAAVISAMGRNVFPFAKDRDFGAAPASRTADGSEEVISDTPVATTTPSVRGRSERGEDRDGGFAPPKRRDRPRSEEFGSFDTRRPDSRGGRPEQRGASAALGWRDRVRDDRRPGPAAARERPREQEQDRFPRRDDRGKPRAGWGASKDRRPPGRFEDERGASFRGAGSSGRGAGSSGGPGRGGPSEKFRFGRAAKPSGGKFPTEGRFSDRDRPPQGRVGKFEDSRDRFRKEERGGPRRDERGGPRRDARIGGDFRSERQAPRPFRDSASREDPKERRKKFSKPR